MNKANLIYGDDSEYLSDLFLYLDFLLEEGKEAKEKAEKQYRLILDRLEMNAEAESLPRLEYLIDSVSEGEAKEFLRVFLAILLKQKLNPQFHQRINHLFLKTDAKEGEVSPSLSDYMDLLWMHLEPEDLEVRRYAEFLFIKDFIELLFPELYQTDDYLNAPIEADIRLVDYLTGGDAYVPPFTKRFFPEKTPSLLFMEDVLSQEKKGFKTPFSRILLWGESGGGKKSSLEYLASESDRVLICFFVSKDYTSRELSKELRYAERETFFYHGVLAICGMEHFVEEDEFLSTFSETPEVLIPNIFFLMDTDEEPEKSSYERIRIGAYDDGQRLELWKTFLSDATCDVDESVDFDVLANTFVITPGKMKNAITEAKRAEESVITKKSLYTACYNQLGHILSDKATRIVTTMSWEDIKLGEKNMTYLRDICNSILYRHVVHYKWNFKKKLPYGEGISILFSGPPGTGKTMAAGVLANELGMEIYRIDLSQIMDKYVGETEKNIKAIFSDANKMSCILFFDEADAIFNKRMNAAGANERFANIESALLLQCIEEYNGISILATNDPGRIDSAFMRRFKYHIVFLDPDEEVRLEIWKSVFPKEAPLAKDVDFEILARTFELTGALIKNIAVASAYLAACSGKEIGMSEIVKAIYRELEKNKMAVSPEAAACFQMYIR